MCTRQLARSSTQPLRLPFVFDRQKTFIICSGGIGGGTLASAQNEMKHGDIETLTNYWILAPEHKKRPVTEHDGEWVQTNPTLFFCSHSVLFFLETLPEVCGRAENLDRAVPLVCRQHSADLSQHQSPWQGLCLLGRPTSQQPNRGRNRKHQNSSFFIYSAPEC